MQGREMMKRLRGIVPLVPVGLVLALALLPASAPANTAAATIDFVGAADLVLPLGTADVTVRYSCLPPSPGELVVELDEKGTAFGANIGTPAICDGKNHSVTLNVAPGPFTPGTATGTATVFNADGQAIGRANQQVNIR
jgi:hypothetical protein